MSGIMAILSLDGRAVPGDLARAQLQAIAHRGEWEPKLWEAPGIALGHVNLPRTPEAEREVLPASDPTDRYWITWDGRLDNRDELAGLLQLDAERARQMTDADYVLAAYKRWHDESVHHLLGDWAVVIWDSQERRLFCAKDPVGYKQLFYREVDGCLLVGSEPQQLFAATSDAPEPDRDYTLRYLSGLMQVEEKTWLAGVSVLHGGRTLTAAEAGVVNDSFWTQPRVTKRQYKRPEEYVDEFVHTFDDAVRVRLRTNQKIGVYLSGGIDSSYVAAIATKLGTRPVALTSFAPGTDRMDERAYAALVVTKLGLDQINLDIRDCGTLTSDWLADESFDGPFHPPQGGNHVRLGVTARHEGIGVVLGGEGGDEWMNGPEHYLASTVAHGKIVLAWKLARIHHGRRKAARVLARRTYRGLMPFAWQRSLDRARNRTRPDLTHLNGNHPPDIMSHLQNVLAWHDESYDRVQWDIYRQINWLEPSWRDRHEASPNGVDRRPPFFDLRLIELMSSTPAWIKRFQGRRKDVLRNAEYRVLPAEIADRMDWGLYDELYFDGLSKESTRVETALAATGTFLGKPAHDLAGLQTSGGPGMIDWSAWRAISTGLWLTNLGVNGTAKSREALSIS